MSTTTQFFSGGIKSIQRGVINIPTTTGSATATISSVTTGKSELRLLGQRIDTAASTAVVVQSFPTIELTNATTITATRGAAAVSVVNVSWELTEWN
jgi:hypothetical protein